MQLTQSVTPKSSYIILLIYIYIYIYDMCILSSINVHGLTDNSTCR